MVEPYEVPFPFVIRRSGRVQSIRRLRPRGRLDFTVTNGGYEVVPFEDELGFLLVSLVFNANDRQYVHRLVAEKYLPNPKGYEHVLFKDGNVKNCSADNLEWCP